MRVEGLNILGNKACHTGLKQASIPNFLVSVL